MLIDLDYETIAAARKLRDHRRLDAHGAIAAAVAEAADNTIVHDNSRFEWVRDYPHVYDDEHGYLYSNDSGTVRIPDGDAE